MRGPTGCPAVDAPYLRDDSLATTESAGDAAGTSEDRGEERIDDSLTGDQRSLTREFLGDRTRSTDGPRNRRVDRRHTRNERA